MPRNASALPGQVWPGMRIHVIDIDQPPGIGMSRIADIELHQATVSAALAANSRAAIPMKDRCEACAKDMGMILSVAARRALCSGLRVLVVVAPPETVLVAAERRAIEPLVHAPQAVE